MRRITVLMESKFGEKSRTCRQLTMRKHVQKVREMVLGKGLAVSALGSYVNPLMPWYQQHLEEAFKIAQGLRTKSCANLVGRRPFQTINPEDKRMINFRLTSLTQWAQFRQLTLGLENA